MLYRYGSIKSVWEETILGYEHIVDFGKTCLSATSESLHFMCTHANLVERQHQYDAPHHDIPICRPAWWPPVPLCAWEVPQVKPARAKEKLERDTWTDKVKSQGHVWRREKIRRDSKEKPRAGNPKVKQTYWAIRSSEDNGHSAKRHTHTANHWSRTFGEREKKETRQEKNDTMLRWCNDKIVPAKDPPPKSDSPATSTGKRHIVSFPFCFLFHELSKSKTKARRETPWMIRKEDRT